MLFFFNDTATTEIYTLSLHDALPICARHPRSTRRRRSSGVPEDVAAGQDLALEDHHLVDRGDRKSTRLNSSHQIISYAVFCLKKKKCQSRLCSSYYLSADSILLLLTC